MWIASVLQAEQVCRLYIWDMHTYDIYLSCTHYPYLQVTLAEIGLAPLNIRHGSNMLSCDWLWFSPCVAGLAEVQRWLFSSTSSFVHQDLRKICTTENNDNHTRHIMKIQTAIQYLLGFFDGKRRFQIFKSKSRGCCRNSCMSPWHAFQKKILTHRNNRCNLYKLPTLKWLTQEVSPGSTKPQNLGPWQIQGQAFRMAGSYTLSILVANKLLMVWPGWIQL